VTTPYVDITDARIAANKPGTTGLMTDFRNNDRHFNELFGTIGIFSDQAIYDDFAAEAIDGDIWISDSGGATGTAPSISATDHYCELSASGASGFSNILAATKKMRVRLSNTQSVVMAFRAKTTDDSPNIAFGLQDASFTGTTAQTDTTDFIGVIRGSAGKWKAKVNKGGAGTTSADLGNVGNWTAFLFNIVQTGSALTVDAYIDGGQISGFPVSSNVPDTITLRPCFSVVQGGADLGIWRIDYATFFWSERPLAP
jgi:hypothetical protein